MSQPDLEISSFIAQLIESRELSEMEIKEIETYLRGEAAPQENSDLHAEEPAQPQPPPAPVSAKPEMEQDEEDNMDIRVRISKMRMPEKIKLAMFGNASCRALLINDPNRLIQLSVLKNPKLRIHEVEEFVKSTNLSDVTIRRIADTGEMMKSYRVKLSLVTNPKTPGDVALKWLRYINNADLKKLARSKSISALVSTTARKRLADETK